MEYFKWSFSGIDLDLDGTGGRECVEFLPPWQRSIETCVIVCLALLQFVYCWPKVRLALPVNSPCGSPRENGASSLPKEAEDVDNGKLVDKTTYVCQRHHDWTGRRLLLLVLSLTFGIEMGYKLASRSVLWVLNPCHCVTIVQLFLLSAPPSPLVTTIFRLHLHMLNGPVIAIVFPVLNTRQLPMEQFIYYLQHVLIVVIPYFFLRQGQLYTAEPAGDMSWAVASLSVQTLYHFIVLQGVGMLTMVNLDNMLCPAISDPFHGRWYRICAVGHQTALILIFGKIITFVYCRLSKFVDGFSQSGIEADPLPPITKAVTFAEQPLCSNLHRLFESIPEPPSVYVADNNSPLPPPRSESNGRLKAC